ncbi:gamma-aminobutyric acid type B receptor subunit 2 [Biomphalaria pfeifferi]|uniref:Gamma-aminobutyric acid type B receptor subunit 2 n=1 Tax=Biomphalaria pfeifferi TaxID=112525 RepID=A0AAD8F9Y4_BIOPF|nr:gamma-aminobutyric acid type B receptor subunit 2 [Biomphalaria pfeifferi]
MSALSLFVILLSLSLHIPVGCSVEAPDVTMATEAAKDSTTWRSSDHSSPSTKNTVLNIIGLFAMSGRYPAGIAYFLATLLAVEHINKREDILPGYKLQINAHNTNCDVSRGLDAIYKEFYDKNKTSIMTLGGTCSPVTEVTAQVSNQWGLLQVSYSSLSPFLSNSEIFPSFFRVMTPEHNLTHGRLKLCKEMGWKKVHIIYENYNVFSMLNEILKQDLKQEGIDVANQEMFTNDPEESVINLKKKDARIIIANMYEGKGRKLACSAYNNDKDGTWYKKVVWLFPSFYDRHWMDVNDTACGCTPEQIRQVIGRYFAVSSQTICKQIDYLTENGLNPTQFKEEFSGTRLYNMLKSEIPKEFEDYYQTFFSDGSVYNEHRAPEAYDAVWAIAMALNNTLTNLTESGDVNGLENFNYHNETLLKIMRDSMQKVRFNSLSCEFFFNNNGDRIPGIEIYQFKNDNASGFELLGQCHLYGSDGQWNCSLNESKIVWDSGVRPVDETKNKNVTKNIDVYMRNGFWILASFGMTMSAGLLVFNVCNKCHRIVKMSSPRLNNIILLGCMISYSTIYIMDVKEEVTCILRTFTVILSFSLSFGALFAKTWRVYEIFTAGHKVLNTRMLRDSSLFLIVAILVVINSSVLVAWMIISPQMPTFVNIGTTPEATEHANTKFTEQYQKCDSKYRAEFIWALIAIQGVVIIFGTFLAIQTRKVSFPELNDSKWIALCIYNVVVLGPVSVFVVMATEDKPQVNYALESSMIFLVTTMTQSLIFFPKIIAFKNHNRSITVFNVGNNLELHGLKRVLSCLCMTRSLKRLLVSENSSGSFDVSQQTMELDVSFDSSDCVGIKHQNKMKIPLGKSKSLSPEKRIFRKLPFKKSSDESWMSTSVAHISYRTKTVQSPVYCSGRASKEKDVRMRFKVFSNSYLPRSRSDSHLNINGSEKIAPNVAENLPDFCEIQTQLKPWRSLSTMPTVYSSLQEKISLERINVLADLKLTSMLGFKATWVKDSDKLTQLGIEEFIKRIKI